MGPARQLYALVDTHVGALLAPHGFTGDRGAFQRRTPGDVVHMVVTARSGAGYHVRVFATSPLIEPLFGERYPNVGIPSDSYSSLHPVTGVGLDQHRFLSADADAFIRVFEKETRPALERFALPYLDAVTDLDDLLPHVRRAFYRGATLWHLGRPDEAGPILRDERERLSSLLPDDTGVVPANLAYIDDLLRRSRD